MQAQVSNLEEQHAAATKKADIAKNSFWAQVSSSIDAVSPQVEQPDILKQLAILEEKAQTAVQALSAAQIRQDALRKQ